METEEKETIGENFEDNLYTYTDGLSITTGGSITISSGSGSSYGTVGKAEWSEPELVDVDEGENYLALTYTQAMVSSFYSYTPNIHIDNERRVYKIIYSCRGGKWHKSDKIYGKIIPPTKEAYTDFVYDLEKII